ncbi:MAG: TIGR02452 family protein [Fibrella sp.]|nr:TIGR02452 family protein [Armatimonadota bacterium]
MTHIIVLPVIDSERIAYANRNALAISRDRAFLMGEEAVNIIGRGTYSAPSGKLVAVADAVNRAVSETQSIPPTSALPIPTPLEDTARLTLSVANETTFQALQRLQRAGGQPLALNFASGTNPGGGFLRGSTAQEETLARSSGLYAAIKDNPMYRYHKTECERGMASEWAILSPGVPVFRADDGTLLETPWHCDILTCAAPKADIVGLERATTAMRKRVHRVLEIAYTYGYRSLVLGAWGCGAYHNDPTAVAGIFRDALTQTYLGPFDEVVFAISDWSLDRRYLGPFRDTFAELG